MRTPTSVSLFQTLVTRPWSSYVCREVSVPGAPGGAGCSLRHDRCDTSLAAHSQVCRTLMQCVAYPSARSKARCTPSRAGASPRNQAGIKIRSGPSAPTPGSAPPFGSPPSGTDRVTTEPTSVPFITGGGGSGPPSPRAGDYGKSTSASRHRVRRGISRWCG